MNCRTCNRQMYLIDIKPLEKEVSAFGIHALEKTFHCPKCGKTFSIST